jgi:transcriptional regulator with XRE-family HTH domain
MNEIVSFSEQNRFEIGARIAGLRQKSGYKSMEIAHFMDIHRCTYSEIEGGNRLPSTDNIFKLCQIFDVTADYILYGKELDMEMAKLRGMLEKQNPRRTRKIIEGLMMMFED